MNTALRRKYEEVGQAQLFRFLDRERDDSGSSSPSFLASCCASLAADLEELDPLTICSKFWEAKAREEEEERRAQEGEGRGDGDTITPASLPDGAVDDFVRERWEKAGLDAIREGKVAAVLLAGGQGTRLGYDGPKGAYDLGLPSGKTLFQLLAERLLSIGRIAGSPDRPPRLYIMTSPINHDQTVSFFQEKGFFGLPPDGVRFFSQGTLPCLSEDGKILMSDAGSLTRAPDGNGGVYRALSSSGMIRDMRNLGVQFLHVFSVDNALTLPVDPKFMGYCIETQSQCGNKSVWKARAEEKVGVLARKNGRACVIEYIDLPPELRVAVRESDGKLLFGAANICNHFFSLDFIEFKVLGTADSALPYHLARKKIPVVREEDGRPGPTPSSPNGIKLETFIFDAFPLADDVAVYEAKREDEFAPVKNAPGADTDSPDTARAMLSAQAKRWLESAGATIMGDGFIELSPLLTYAGEGLGSFNGRVIDLTDQHESKFTYITDL